MNKHKIEWDIRSGDGKITEGNEWAKDLAEHIGKVCWEHGKGFIFAPWGGSNLTCKSFFATSHTNPAMFAGGMAMMISNYIKKNPLLDKDEIEDYVNSIAKTALAVYEEEKNGKVN